MFVKRAVVLGGGGVVGGTLGSRLLRFGSGMNTPKFPPFILIMGVRPSDGS